VIAVVALGAGTAGAVAAPTANTAALPGAGKPTVTIGDKNFPEQYVLGALYAQALKAKGYTVKLRDNIGSSEITWKALKAGNIDLYPEYTGTLLTAIAKRTKSPTSAKGAYASAKSYASTQGFTLLNATPFSDSDVLVTKKAFAQKNKLGSIADLKKLGKKVKLGGPPEFATRLQALPGLKKAYGINPTFKPVAIGIAYKAIDGNQVDVQNVFTTDGQLASGKYTALKDPKGVFGFQNVAPVVNKKVLATQGRAFSDTINAVSKLLTLKAIQTLNKAVVIDKRTPTSVAKAFLKANKLL
jgi:osmoprotectant transport system substrate-binding protein